MSNPVAISVIVTTCRDPVGLGRVLQALAKQSRLPDEVLVADDGSPPAETLALLRTTARNAPFQLTHAWQPDIGFRAARSRNNAIHNARGRFLAFLDQDTMPHPSWLAAHHNAVSALKVGLGHILEWRSDDGKREATAIAEGALHDLHAAEEWRALRALHRKFLFYALLRRLRLAPANKPKLRACNFSVHSSALEAVNGFDERYEGWGQEDDDLGRRLYRAGIRPVVLVAKAPVSHRRHPPRRAAEWRAGSNQELYHRPFSARCELGLDSHPHADVRVTVLN